MEYFKDGEVVHSESRFTKEVVMEGHNKPEDLRQIEAKCNCTRRWCGSPAYIGTSIADHIRDHLEGKGMTIVIGTK